MNVPAVSTSPFSATAIGAPAPAAIEPESTSRPATELAAPAGELAVDLRLSLSVELGIRVSIDRERATAAAAGVEERYEEIDEDDGDERSVDGAIRDRARGIARRLNRLVNRATQPLVRGRTGVDAETRAEIRELRRELRAGLKEALAEARDGEDFDVNAYAASVSEAVDRFADGFASVVGSAPADDDGAVPFVTTDAPIAPELREGAELVEPRAGRPFRDREERLARVIGRVDGILEFVQEQLRELLDVLEVEDGEPAAPIPLTDGTRDLQPALPGENTLGLFA